VKLHRLSGFRYTTRGNLHRYSFDIYPTLV
jgi:hypothetical protein